MASATVELPPLLEAPDAFLAELQNAARLALDAELPSVLGEIAASGTVPADRGALTRAVANAAQPAVVETSRVVALIVVAGEASAYADVMNLGRRPGQPMTWRFLYYAPGDRSPNGWRGGWVNRARRDWVLETAQTLRSLEPGKKRAAEVYERRAAYLLAVSIASAIRTRGIRARRFIADRIPDIHARCAELVAAEIAPVIARWTS